MSTGASWHWLRPVAEARGFRHRFCGVAESASCDCTNCGVPLLHYASFDARDPRLGLRELGLALVPCAFCWRCVLAQEPLHYRLSAAGAIELVAFGRGEPVTDFPYPEYPREFPGSALELVEPTPRELSALERIRAGGLWHDLEPDVRHLIVPRHRAGIELPGEAPPPCTLCSRPTRAFATFGDANLDPRGFTGNETVETHFSICADCATVAVVQTCG